MLFLMEETEPGGSREDMTIGRLHDVGAAGVVWQVEFYTESVKLDDVVMVGALRRAGTIV